MHECAAGKKKHQSDGKPQYGSSAVILPSLRVKDRVNAVKREITDHQQAQEHQSPDGREHAGGVPERVEDDLHEKKRRNAQNNCGSRGGFGRKGHGRTQTQPIVGCLVAGKERQTGAAEQNRHGSDVKRKGHDAQHQKDGRMRGCARGVGQSCGHGGSGSRQIFIHDYLPPTESFGKPLTA